MRKAAQLPVVCHFYCQNLEVFSLQFDLFLLFFFVSCFYKPHYMAMEEILQMNFCYLKNENASHTK